MIPILSWRNIWRSPTRSGVVIAAVALGIWAALSLSGFMTGIMKSYVRSAIENSIGHLQIHAPEFTEEYELKHYLPNVTKVERQLDSLPQLDAYSTRTVTNGMASSSKGARGVMIKGVVPQKEAAVSAIEDKLTEGEFFPEMRGNGVLIGAELADKLNLKLRSKLVLTFQDLNREITAAAFRVVGIFDTGNTAFDGGTVFVERTDLNRLILPQQTGDHPPALAHEVAILLKDVQAVESVDTALAAALPELEVKTYREVSPDLELYESQIQNISLIYLVVIMLALVFGIINTMLMAVLERIKELGMLMAIGMNKLKVFTMILLEAIMLGLVSAPIGLLLGYFTIQYLGEYGVDLSAYSGGLADYGIDQVIYFEVNPNVYWEMAIGVFVTAVLAAIYPALKAIRLKPVEALQHV
ncbi:MAG: FtsX-like permease family protein [Bacteroidetes bacterium]|nr:FtsX-like permease family protein [Bacteroidota bacterium]